MGKRIHKRPGTTAHERAMKKSATRMARDFLRMPDEKRLSSVARWLENKPEKVPMFMEAMKGVERREKSMAERQIEFTRAMEQLGVLGEGCNKNFEAIKTGRRTGRLTIDQTLNKLRTLRTGLQLLLEGHQARLREIYQVKKSLPRENFRLLRRTILKERIKVKKHLKAVERMLLEDEHPYG